MNLYNQPQMSHRPRHSQCPDGRECIHYRYFRQVSSVTTFVTGRGQEKDVNTIINETPSGVIEKTNKRMPLPLGSVIEITNHGMPCPHGARCYRTRWWIEPYQERGFIEKAINGKPDKHYHIVFGAKWQ